MKTANYVIAVILMLILGSGPILAFARPRENAMAPIMHSRRLPPRPRLRRPLPKPSQTPALLEGQTSTTLPDGTLLLTGGMDQEQPTRSIKVFNPRSGKSKALPGMGQARAWHTATMLPDGRVFIFGGVGKNQRVLNTGLIVDPITGQTEDVLAKSGLSTRAYHTATLLTDGRVLIVGGRSETGLINEAQLWDFRTGAAHPAGMLSLLREKHSAALLAEGNVLIKGGVDESGIEVKRAELFNVETNSFSFTTISAEQNAGETPFLAASVPADGAVEIPVESRVVLRFSQQLPADMIRQTIRFESLDEGVAFKVVPAENGRLAFISPLENLRKGAAYKLTLNGPIDGSLNITPASISFTTVTDKDPTNFAGGDVDWLPTAENMHGNWQTRRRKSSWEDQPPLLAPQGETALAGKVLTLTGQPLANVTISVNGSSTRTDGSGRFLLTVSTGHYVMLIDGRSANRAGRRYGIFRTRVDITAGITNVLDYTIWMPKLDMAHAVTIPSPTDREVVVTNPSIPGLELHLPAGTVIRDLDGKVVTELSITPIPTDRPPIPLPVGVSVPVFASIQPGGAQIIPPRARLIYPNYNNEAPGKRINFWNYDPQDKGWYIYGQGTVTPDGRQIVPDPGVVIYEFSGIMISDSGDPPGTGREPGDNDNDGDPVDLSTGLFVLSKTDLSLPDTIPITLTRTYRPGDGASRPFGIGASHPYEMFLWSNNNYHETDLILPDGGRVHYVRVSPGTAYWDAVYEHTGSPSAFYKSQISWNGSGWDLRLTNGLVFVFPDSSPLQSIRDRYGNQLTITREFGVLGNITQLTTPNGRWLQFSYGSGNRISQIKDNSGRTVSYTYDSSGRLWKVYDANGGVTEYTYDTAHRMLTIKDPRGIIYLTNEYDSNGRVIRQTQADNSVYEFAYTLNGSGKVTQTDVTDARDNVRRVTFNSSGYTLTDTRALGTSEQRTITYERQSGSNFILNVTDPLNRQTSYSYDSYGEVLTITRLTGTANTATTTLAYEPNFHQVTSVTDPLNHTSSYTYDLNGNVTTVTDPLNHQTTFTYNGAGQVTSMTDALNHTTQWTYDGGDLTSVTNPLGKTLTRTVDALGRPILVVDPLGGMITYEYNNLNQPTQITDSRGGITSFSYNENGSPLSITDANNHTINYSYDNLERLESITDHVGSMESYDYDENGNLTQFTDRRGNITTYKYDHLNRMNFTGFGTAGTSQNPTYDSTITYQYDLASRLTTAVDSLTGTITRSYNDGARTLTEETPQGSVSYSFDKAGRLTSKSVSGQQAISYTADNANRLTQITQGSASVSFSYDDANRRTSVGLPNGLSMNYGYDTASQLTSITYKNGATVIGDLSYTFDSAGRRTSVAGSYARTGLPSVLNSTTYNNANRLTQRNSVALTYDSNGNLTSDGTNSYTWNSRNQLQSISGTGLTAAFQYDAFGRRVQKSINGVTTSYVYDGHNVVKEQNSVTGTANLLTGSLDELFTRTDSSGTTNFLTDGLGSTIALADSSGAIQTQYTYDSFGQTTVTGTANGNATQFTGRENDGTGLYYYRARYYSPLLHRFISEDPLRIRAGDTNFYSYVQNSPLNAVDPTGQFTHIVAGALIGGALNTALYLAAAGISGQPITGTGIANAAISGALQGALVAAFPIAGFGMANISANALIGGVAAAAGQIGANVITRQNWYNGVTSSAIAGALAGGFFGGLKGFANTPIDPYASGFFDGVGSAFQSSLAMMFSFMGDLFGRICWSLPW